MNTIVGIGELLWDLFPNGGKVAGGAPFNFTFHCRQLGHNAIMVSRVGDDELGHELRAEVRKLGLSDEFIQVDREHPTGTVRVRLDDSGQPTFSITERVAWDHLQLNETLASLSTNVAAVAFGTLAQRSEPARGTIRDFVQRVHKIQGLRVCDINIRPPHEDPDVIDWCLDHSDWVKVNEREQTALGYFFADQPWPAEQPRPVWICTRGAEGCEVVLPDWQVYSEPGIPGRVVDTVGAGDAFTAAMVCLHWEGRSLPECIRFANAYATRVCEFQGGTPRIERADVEKWIEQRP